MRLENLDPIEFLAFGAIGVALFLFILSFVLLHREQKLGARHQVYKNIKSYMGFSLILALFFGGIEIYKFTNSVSEAKRAEHAINAIYEEYFITSNDSTIDEKITRIKTHLLTDDHTIDTAEICDQVLRELDICKNELNTINKGFYSNIIKLRNAILDDPDNWINVEYNINEKTQVYGIMEDILISIEVFQNDGQSTKDIILEWKLIKQRWENDESKFKYITYSDIPYLVREYLERFHPVV